MSLKISCISLVTFIQFKQTGNGIEAHLGHNTVYVKYFNGVKPSLVTFQEEICMYLWGPVHLRPVWLSTECVCVCVWAEQSALVFHGRDWVVFEHLWTASLLFASVLMVRHSRLSDWADWISDCWFHRSLFIVGAWPMSSIQTRIQSRNASPTSLIFTIYELPAFPSWGCISVLAWISLQLKLYIRWKTCIELIMWFDSCYAWGGLLIRSQCSFFVVSSARLPFITAAC